MAWEEDVKALKTPVLIITGDADVATLEHSVALFRLLGGGVMGDMGKPLPASRLAVLPATSHTAVITPGRPASRLHRAVPEGRDAEGVVRVGTDCGRHIPDPQREGDHGYAGVRDFRDRHPRAGEHRGRDLRSSKNPSLRKTVEPLTWRAACMSLPPGPASRMISLAPNARL